METCERNKYFFWQNVFLFIFFMHMKNIFSFILRFFHKKLLILSKCLFSNWNTFHIECNEGLLLTVYMKTMFFEGQNRQINKNKIFFKAVFWVTLAWRVWQPLRSHLFKLLPIKLGARYQGTKRLNLNSIPVFVGDSFLRCLRLTKVVLVQILASQLVN